MSTPSERDTTNAAAVAIEAQTGARALIRAALKGALATIDRRSGAPYASLVTVATASDGMPLLLVSRLALHTQNILADPRASLMLDGTDAHGDPMAGGRVSVTGRIVATGAAADRRRFLARHTAAAGYADFPDFGFHRLVPESAHYIGGFGRIVDIASQHLLTDLTGAEALIGAEDEIVDHMNKDHRDALGLCAAAHGGMQGGAQRHDAAPESGVTGEPGDGWRMTGIDPEGFDLVGAGKGLRIGFENPVRTPGEARRALVALAAAARAPSATGNGRLT